MILGVGIDLVETARLAEAIERHGARFLQRVFSPGEQRYCDGNARRIEHYAARFAAKEAAWKALGLDGGLPWKEIEVERLPSGAPRLVLHGGTAARATARGLRALHVSLSHTESTATAMVVAEQ